MNKEKRKELNEITNKLEDYKFQLELIMDSEQMSFDSLNEGLQSTMRGRAMEEAIDQIDEAISLIDDAIEHIRDAAI